MTDITKNWSIDLAVWALMWLGLYQRSEMLESIGTEAWTLSCQQVKWATSLTACLESSPKCGQLWLMIE